MKIANITAREILDSRGFPTIECKVSLDDGTEACASVPSGASTGSHEAIELRDGDKRRYGGRGVIKAIDNIHRIIAPELKGMCPTEQRFIDKRMIDLDDTHDKNRIGANAILATSLAVARAAASSLGIPFYRYLGGSNAHIIPVPMLNIINGGRHSNAPIAFQEFMIRPINACCIHEAVRMSSDIFYTLKGILNKRDLNTGVGDEGGFAPSFNGIEDALNCLLEAIVRTGFKPGEEVTIAIDCAASEFYRNMSYDYTIFEGNSGKKLSSIEQANYLKSLVERFPIDSIEDGMAEDDWEGWHHLTKLLGNKIQLVGDDLFVTNEKRLMRGIEEGCANAILIKPNQIGTLTETMDTITIAQKHGYKAIISHRSGETEDTSIADIAVAVNAGQIKCGSVTRTERTAKYNRLFAIEEKLGRQASFGENKCREHDLTWFTT